MRAAAARRAFLRLGCAHCALLFAGAARSQVAPESGWSLPPRFAAPDPATDEGGLWATMAREEQRLRRSPFLLRDAGLRDYLQGIACKLGRQHCVDIRVYPVRSAWFNASMAPNGMMQVWSGLLLRMENESQLAAVLGHELGHFLQRHSLERLRDAKSRSAFGTFMAAFGLVGAIGQLAALAGAFAYSRDQEREADRIGVQLMAEAGYDTREAAKVWGNLLAEAAARPESDATKSSVLFASHPPSEERRDALSSMARPGGETFEQVYQEKLKPWYAELLDDELRRGQYEETLVLLERMLGRHGNHPGLLYYRGETRRLRAADGDLDRAQADLQAAAAAEAGPPQAYRALGQLYRSRNDPVAARESFSRYLERAPTAPDAALIKTYLDELKT
jgi:predicted Zn-dependent protease